MGFSGGGSNVLLPHTHDGTVSQDGGPLDFNNITQASLNAGDVIFSDGVHLQRLAIGNVQDVLEVNPGQTAPQWTAPTGGGLSGPPVRSYTTSSTPQVTSSSSMIDCTSFGQTLSAGSGYALVTFNGFVESNENFYFRWSFSVDGDQPEIKFKGSGTFRSLISLQAVTSSLAAQDVQLQMRVHDPAGTMTLQADSSNGNMYVLEFPT